MLIQKAHNNKLSFIAIAFLMLGLSVLWTTPGQAAPVKKFISPEGGKIDFNNSELVIPPGALGTEATALEGLENAMALLETQYDYIDSLPKDPEPSEEWVKDQGPTRGKSKDVKKESQEAKKKIPEGRWEDAKEKANRALLRLDEFRTFLAELLTEGKIGGIAYEQIQQQNEQIEAELVFADSQMGKELQADSDTDVYTLNDASEISDLLNTSLSVLDDQSSYISQLGDIDDQGATLDKCQKAKGKVAEALQKHSEGDEKGTVKKSLDAVKKLDKLDKDIDKLVADGNIGSAAGDTIKAYSDEDRLMLQSIDSCQLLVFEFGPCGTTFNVSAELVIPWDEIIYNDGLFYYSAGSSDVIDLIDMDYWIDDENETVHFFIDHFSEYYYPRR